MYKAVKINALAHVIHFFSLTPYKYLTIDASSIFWLRYSIWSFYHCF